ncbi:hypothetical protein FQA39_LY17940 [Lamprigera yunnana]|nr:hypothetical protein FQA39_LY17940 [Lamprigera yunnana]
MSLETAPEDRSSDTEQEVKSKPFIREVGRNSKGKICLKLKLRDSMGQYLSLTITDSEIENTERTEVRNTQKNFIEPRRKKRNADRRSTAGTASAPGPKGTESKEERAKKEPPGKEKAPTRETGSDEMQEHLAKITCNVIHEGAKWLPLSATTPSDEGYPEDVDRLAFYRRYVYIMSIVPENSVRIPVEARMGLRIAVDQMKDRYMLTLGAVRELRANVKKLNRQLNEERQKNITTTQQQARTASEPATRQEVPRVTYSAVTGQNIQRQRRPTPLAPQDLRKRQTYNVSVLSRDLATTPAEVKRAIENSVNPAKAKAAVREIRETKKGVIIRCERKKDAERLNQAITEKIGERLNSTTNRKYLRVALTRIGTALAGRYLSFCEVKVVGKEQLWISFIIIQHQIHLFVALLLDEDHNRVIHATRNGILWLKYLTLKKFHFWDMLDFRMREARAAVD